jgi:hypothetical protein
MQKCDTLNMTNKKANFSRYNQPVACRMCGKKTTWSEANGNCGLDLCRKCFDQATMDNEHYDGYHETPNTGCRLCKEVR